MRAGLAFVAALLAAVPLSASPASASGTTGPLCVLNSDAYQYTRPLGDYERTVHQGYHFRVHDVGHDQYGRIWFYGHSGESPDDDGWVLAFHVTC
jgi:hypothetical protein